MCRREELVRNSAGFDCLMFGHSETDEKFHKIEFSL